PTSGSSSPASRRSSRLTTSSSARSANRPPRHRPHRAGSGGTAAGLARSGDEHQKRGDDHRRQKLAEPSQVEDVVRDDAAEQRAGDAEERRLYEAQLLTPGDEQPAEAADHEADDAVPDQRPEDRQREPEQAEPEGHEEHDQDQRDERGGHAGKHIAPRRRITHARLFIAISPISRL